MNQRAVSILATYLAKRPLGRLTQLRKVSHDDYVVAIKDSRDGRTQLIHSSSDLKQWLESFRLGECVMPAAAICGRCDRLHIERDFDGELLGNCIGCAAELIHVGIGNFLDDPSNNL